MRPGIAQPTFLVYRECPCGQWLCTGEGATAPVCGQCGEMFVPGGGPREGGPMYGGSDYTESRRLRGLAFVGFLTSEMGAVKAVSRVRGLLGLYGDRNEWTYAADHTERSEPYFGAGERQRASDEIRAANA